MNFFRETVLDIGPKSVYADEMIIFSINGKDNYVLRKWVFSTVLKK